MVHGSHASQVPGDPRLPVSPRLPSLRGLGVHLTVPDACGSVCEPAAVTAFVTGNEGKLFVLHQETKVWEKHPLLSSPELSCGRFGWFPAVFRRLAVVLLQ